MVKNAYMLGSPSLITFAATYESNAPCPTLNKMRTTFTENPLSNSLKRFNVLFHDNAK